MSSGTPWPAGSGGRPLLIALFLFLAANALAGPPAPGEIGIYDEAMALHDSARVEIRVPVDFYAVASLPPGGVREIHYGIEFPSPSVYVLLSEFPPGVATGTPTQVSLRYDPCENLEGMLLSTDPAVPVEPGTLGQIKARY